MMTKKNEFDTVEFFREEKKRIARKISKLSLEELKAYLKSRSKWIRKTGSIKAAKK